MADFNLDLKRTFKKGDFMTINFPYDGCTGKCICWVNEIYGYKDNGALCYYNINADGGLDIDGYVGLGSLEVQPRFSTHAEIKLLLSTIAKEGLDISKCYCHIEDEKNLNELYESIIDKDLSKRELRYLIDKISDYLSTK